MNPTPTTDDGRAAALGGRAVRLAPEPELIRMRPREAGDPSITETGMRSEGWGTPAPVARRTTTRRNLLDPSTNPWRDMGGGLR